MEAPGHQGPLRQPGLESRRADLLPPPPRWELSPGAERVAPDVHGVVSTSHFDPVKNMECIICHAPLRRRSH